MATWLVVNLTTKSFDLTTKDKAHSQSYARKCCLAVALSTKAAAKNDGRPSPRWRHRLLRPHHARARAPPERHARHLPAGLDGRDP
eukprot:5497819-Prymnesium_polylepis.1